jgi:glycerol-3-phosphate responsive antiterminator
MKNLNTINESEISLMVEISMMFGNKTKEQAIEYILKYIISQGWEII